MSLRLAIIGCGAITEHAHLPAAAGLEEVEVTVLVDCDRARAEALAERFGIPRVADDHTELDTSPDAVLVALPNHLHAPVSLDFLRRGINVLVEKPMALTSADCDEMIRTAADTGARLAVGLVRRFLPEVRRVKAVLESGVLGPLESCEVREGRIYDWPTATDAALRPETAGGGVLMDVGVHTLDTLLFWLGEAVSFEYRDDSYGGVESECEIDLVFANGVRGHVELSRGRDLGNLTRIRGAEATLEVDLGAGTVRLDTGDGAIMIEEAPDAEPHDGIFRAQLLDWAEAIRRRGEPAVPGTEGRRSVAVVEACYACRESLAHPWVVPDPPQKQAAMSLKGKSVLVTGGTGFIGGRLVEKLVLEHGAQVRVLARDFSRAGSAARFPVRVIAGDVTDATTVRQAVRGCDAVFHCAYGNRGDAEEQRTVNVDGTRIVAEAVLGAGVPRLVHVSTIAVYGRTPDGAVDETAPGLGPGDHYSRTKREAEQLVLEAHRRDGLPVAVLRPTCVYGPSSRAFTVYPLTELANRRFVLVNGGEGLANVVYVDDVADALILAASVPAAIGEVFLVSGPETVTWKEFYGSYERMLGNSATLAMDVEEVRTCTRRDEEKRRQHEALLSRLADTGLNTVAQPRPRPFDIPSEHMLAFYAAKTVFRIDKAREKLGYEPRFGFAKGIELTEAWARWAGLIQEKSHDASDRNLC